jgi:hypothetical protein
VLRDRVGELDISEHRRKVLEASSQNRPILRSRA